MRAIEVIVLKLLVSSSESYASAQKRTSMPAGHFLSLYMFQSQFCDSEVQYTFFRDVPFGFFICLISHVHRFTNHHKGLKDA
eukprot:3957888-Amphidinium_carterae.1